ncbi:hypothetical protein [Pleomorphovibrio marinus]|uniref:hypothetical protein n=1 Tax=Pleomorphovibrio marinus TaxID=2164132 RepID=UPI0013002417|nr:hypothetical protein [Pleomorphovibrio marinus]
MLVNSLALFLLVLAVEEGEDAVHYFPHTDIEFSEVDYDYVDFPTSVKRSSQELKTEPHPQLLSFIIVFDQGLRLVARETVIDEKFTLFGRQVLEYLLEIIISTNAP